MRINLIEKLDLTQLALETQKLKYPLILDQTNRLIKII